MDKMSIIIAAFALLSNTAQAANLRFLQYTVLAEFDKEHTASFMQFVAESVDTPLNQAAKEWHSPHSIDRRH